MRADGSRIGKAIADQVAHALKGHTNAAAPVLAEAANRARRDFLEGLETHLTPFLKDMWGRVAADESVPEGLRDMAGQIAGPDHQFTALLQFAAAALSIFGLAGAIAKPLEDKLMHDRYQETPNARLSPQEAALAEIKGVMELGDAVKEARENGIDDTRFDWLLGITGEPPPIQELLLLWRRGQIDTARLDHGIKQSRTKDEWIDAIKDLRYGPLPAGDAVEFVLKGHMDAAKGAELYAHAGLDPALFATHVKSTGRPPGPQEELELLNRGEVSQAHVEQAIRQSDVNNDYIADLIKLRVYFPPVRSIAPLIRSGAFTDADALHYYASQGVPAALAAKMLKAAKKEKTHKAHTATEAQVVRDYVERIVDHAAAVKRLETLGYDAEEAAFELSAADAEQAYRMRTQAAAVIRARYVAHRIPRSVASADLDALKVPHEARDQLIRLWDIEHEASKKALSASEVLAMHVRELAGWDEAATLAWLESDGYDTADAHSLIQLAEAGSARVPGRARNLTEAQVLKLYKTTRLTEADTLTRLTDMGLTDTNARLLMAQNAPPGG